MGCCCCCCKEQLSVPYDSLYDITENSIDNVPIKLSSFKGNVLIIVNVASSWGRTASNYEGLVKLDLKYGPEGLKILLFPCNQFFRQERGTVEEIKKFIQKTGGDFTIFAKSDVNGPQACDVFKYLRLNSRLRGKRICWNFGKFLVDREGNVVGYYGFGDLPMAMEGDIQKCL